MKPLIDCNRSSIGSIMLAVAGIEGYRSIRELFCNYMQNFGYTLSDLRCHVEWKYGVYYSLSSYKYLYYETFKSRDRRLRDARLKHIDRRVPYHHISKHCLGYRTFREAMYFLRKVEGLTLHQIGQLYGVTKSALYYRIKQDPRLKDLTYL